jgi:hypothetical protein
VVQQLVEAQRRPGRGDEGVVAVKEAGSRQVADGSFDSVALAELGGLAGDLTHQLGHCDLGGMEEEDLLQDG